MMKTLISRLKQYEEHEARSIVRLLLRDVFGFTLTDICAGALQSLDNKQKLLLEQKMKRLEKGEPIQYVTGKADFCSNTFHVRSGCLIPRPETEELCKWVMQEMENDADVLDIATGSGCIAITLKKSFPNAKVTAWDISSDALDIAEENCMLNKTDIAIVRQDALNPPIEQEMWDIIVSNPPYICKKEAVDMEKNVLEYEPDLALFVPDDDPLLFYRAIATYSSKALRKGGRLFFEINPTYSADIKMLLEGQGFSGIEIKKDEYGKNRMAMGMIM